MIVAVVLAAVTVAGGAALLAFRVSRGRQNAARVLYQVTPAPPRPPPLPSQPRSAIEPPRPEIHVHHHWHGLDAEDVAEILRRQLP